MAKSQASIDRARIAARDKARKLNDTPPDKFRRTRYMVNGEGNVTSETYALAGRTDEEVTHVPEPAFISRTSTLYGPSGEVRAQWVMEKPEDIQRQRMIEEWAKAMAAGLPTVVPIKGPAKTSVLNDLLCVYPVGDHHMGMLSWRHETGAHYDIDISEKLLLGAINHLVGITPAAREGIVVFLGDFLHYDSFDTVTPTSRNMLDADGRFPKMVRAAVRTMRYVIERAAQKHSRLKVIVEIGNHDLASSIWLMEALHNIYENNPRITIDTSPKHFHYYEFGKVLLGVHHGHGVKMAQLPQVMAADMPEAWGRSQHRHWLTGHIHIRTAEDFQGCSVESFRILAPNDAWAANKGYRSKRDMKALVFHREHGEVARHTVNPAMLEASR